MIYFSQLWSFLLQENSFLSFVQLDGNGTVFFPDDGSLLKWHIAGAVTAGEAGDYTAVANGWTPAHVYRFPDFIRLHRR